MTMLAHHATISEPERLRYSPKRGKFVTAPKTGASAASGRGVVKNAGQRGRAMVSRSRSEVDYVLVDDFVGMGGTLANLRGYIESNGGRVLGAVALTGKPYSAKLTLEEKTLEELRQTHGQDLD